MRKLTEDQLKQLTNASFALSDATDYIYDDELWEKAVEVMGELNRYINRNKRLNG